MDKKNIVGSFIGLEKSHVKSHITTSKLGKMSRVKDYDNKKIKKEIKSDLAREERLLKHISSDDFLYKTVIPYNKDIVALDEKIQSSHQLFAAVNIPTVASRVSSEKLPGAVDTPVVASQVVPQQDTVVEAVHPVASETPVVPVVAEKVEKELLDPPDPKMIPPEVTLPKLELRKR